ncbi:uncharacterized protein K452DRAFT_304856 [Aplosporella prunicola CBS 121167]|uniref:Uncharacterized protein n=1 Tax=Aplosporella prunicola CBS 121167 TaxID=1176127 RepID=A0A6A6BS86_9PEZI|nr:uncharacterized protein K452DRAFT_304856 [Aplosporella prunicola CBS 121167]KAF2146959.1 hypothetical protein K452DRAFT_304856 [Aplosporella prunicola CBS 121167]
MLLFHHLLLLFSLLYGICTAIQAVQRNNNNAVQETPKDRTTMHRRELVAATKLSKLARRSNTVELASAFDLEYLEGGDFYGNSPLGATVHVESHKPVLLLEEIEHLLNIVECSSSTISMAFLTDHASVPLEKAFEQLKGGFVVSSHYGCNVAGARNVFRVESYDMSTDEGHVRLSVSRMSWENAFPNLSIKMSSTKEKIVHRPHENFRRQLTPASETSTSSSVSNPINPEETNKAYLSIGKELLETALEIPAVANIVPPPFTIECKDCTTNGTVDFEFFDFQKDCNLEGLLDCINGVNAAVKVEGFEAHVELSATLSREAEFEAPLSALNLDHSLDLTTRKIKDLGSIELGWSPSIFLSYEMNGNITFTYGFKVKMSSALSINLGMKDQTEPNRIGLGKLNVETIPFQAEAKVDNITFSIALRSRLSASFTFESSFTNQSSIGVSAGIQLDMPGLSTKVTSMQAVDANCQPLKDSNTNSDDRNLIEKILTNVYRFDSSAIMNASVFSQVTTSTGCPEEF